ncbi:MAG TPA: histidine phosphatase family protein [Solirubrobacterales bacterium]|nr:histidine phosphatase family protein [Solirubrobacterales bacterium]
MIWLLRHGDAENGSGGDDDSRCLTTKGEQQGRNAGRALAALEVELDACLSSPKARAVEMARLACEPLNTAVEVADELAGGDFDPLDVAGGRANVLLVGHEPDMSSAIARLTGANVELKKGGLVQIEDRRLLALFRPEHLERIAG